MAGTAAKLERLLNLTAALLETSRPLTAAEIARRVPGYPEGLSAFRRAFERDKEELRDMGIPVTIVEVLDSAAPESGYHIRKSDYYLRDPGLEADELAALHLAAGAVRLDGIEGTGALWKLGGVPHSTKVRNAIERDQVHIASLPADAAVVTVFEAVAERRAISFSYRDEARTVDPYRLDFQRGRWYVTGYDHLRAAERNFRLDRIEGAVTPGPPRSFERPSTETPGAQREPWELGEGDAVRGRVLVDAAQAALAINVVGEHALVEERDDGAVVLELPVTNIDGFRSFVLSFLEHAEVLGPPELRADIVAWLDALIATGS
ncbi:MAG: helix-turn-helix transcriptional regulator [Acidimicrobiales bacterium]